MGLEEIQIEVQRFTEARDWEQFHTIRNLVFALQAELGELAELVQWVPDRDIDDRWIEANRQRLSEEWADVFIYLLRLAQVAGIQPETAALEKIRMNAEKYPVDKARGNATKYSNL